MKKDGKTQEPTGVTEGRVKELEEQLATLEKLSKQREADYNSLVTAYDDLQLLLNHEKQKYNEAEELAGQEVSLKNQAYAFILSEGLTDKFLTYVKKLNWGPFHEAINFLVEERNPEGPWIEYAKDEG